MGTEGWDVDGGWRVGHEAEGAARGELSHSLPPPLPLSLSFSFCKAMFGCLQSDDATLRSLLNTFDTHSSSARCDNIVDVQS